MTETKKTKRTESKKVQRLRMPRAVSAACSPGSKLLECLLLTTTQENGETTKRTGDPHQVNNWKAYVNPVNCIESSAGWIGDLACKSCSSFATQPREGWRLSWQCMHQWSTNQRSSSQFCRCMYLLLLLSPQSQSSLKIFSESPHKLILKITPIT